MNNYHNVFLNRHTLLVVIHVQTGRQAIDNAKIAFAEGADGIFLINHQIDTNALVRIYNMVKMCFVNKWVGVNFLDLPKTEALKKAHSICAAGLWVDNVGYQERAFDPLEHVVSFRRKQIQRGARNMMLFGGVAFKGQQTVTNVAECATLVAPYVDVVTTSGAGTGIAPAIEKITSMKKAIGALPLAVASGITPDNVSQFRDIADCFIVASGISDNFTTLNAKKVQALRSKLL